jgi:phospholipase C
MKMFCSCSLSDRRAFMRFLASAAVTAALPKSIEKALALPAHHRTGTIQDVEHVVFLMQENRAFDHYFGTLRGVRGYGDPHPALLPSGKPVWFQPDGNGVLLPFRPAVDDLGLRFLEGTPHGWTDTQAAWNGGKYDRWVANKGRSTMAYLTRGDIPFHYALADAFTICDGYYCSLLGPTDPNRYHMWTGWCGNDGRAGGPVIDNAEAGYGWSTYPERLERAGISWKIYQDIGTGLDEAGHWGADEDAYIGNYGDNSLLFFHQYRNALPGSVLHEKARRGTNIAVPGTPFDALFSLLREDVRGNRLPQVSWIVAPEAFSEHGNWPANYGAWYISQVLDALTSNPEVWSKTALFVMYDENDGFFDHLVPPTPPRSPAEGASTVDLRDEIFAGNADNPRGPYGLGIRVPMLVVSPWSKGGWVCSEVFDHTSLIRFLERRFAADRPGLIESNITAWRRTVCGDLSSAFDFASPNAAHVQFPDTSAYLPAITRSNLTSFQRYRRSKPRLCRRAVCGLRVRCRMSCTSPRPPTSRARRSEWTSTTKASAERASRSALALPTKGRGPTRSRPANPSATPGSATVASTTCRSSDRMASSGSFAAPPGPKQRSISTSTCSTT